MSPEDTDEPYSSILSNPGLVGLLLFGFFAAALLCYIWAFFSQSHKLPAFRRFLILSCLRRTSELRGPQNIYHAAFTLLLCDGFTVILGLFWGILLFLGEVGLTYLTFFNIWYGFRFLSQCQHLITALISIIFVCHPERGDILHTMSEVLDLIPVILVILSFKIDGSILIGVDIYNLLLVLGILVSCCKTTASPMANQGKLIVLLSVSFFLLVCLPNMVLRLLLVDSDRYLVLAVSVLLITNFYVIMSAQLFRLVLKVEDKSDNSRSGCAVGNQVL